MAKKNSPERSSRKAASRPATTAACAGAYASLVFDCGGRAVIDRPCRQDRRPGDPPPFPTSPSRPRRRAWTSRGDPCDPSPPTATPPVRDRAAAA